MYVSFHGKGGGIKQFRALEWVVGQYLDGKNTSAFWLKHNLWEETKES
jgi:hypothetical protein